MIDYRRAVWVACDERRQNSASADDGYAPVPASEDFFNKISANGPTMNEDDSERPGHLSEYFTVLRKFVWRIC